MDHAAGPNGAPAVTIAAGDAAALRAQIEATRAELGDTVAALAVKADVKAQARDRLEQLKRQLRDRAATARRDGGDRVRALQQRARRSRAELRERARATTPETVTQATATARERMSANPLPYSTAAALAAGFALGRLTGR